MYYYVEIKDKKIISYGCASDKETATRGKSGNLMELTITEYHLLSDCGGDIQTGKRTLKNLFKKILMFESDWE
jgi:hypothetical protein